MGKERLIRELRAWLEPDLEVALFWKGRVALWAILEALDIGEGDEVILPAFTCVVVPSAILYRGARPVYVDIDAATYTLDPARVRAAIGPRTRAILAQNTFGQSADLAALGELARAHGLTLIEDCAHGFGARYRGRPNGAWADVAFFSTQWNKPFTTGLGGIAVTRDLRLGHRLRTLARRAPRPSARDELTLALLAVARARLLRPATYWPAVELYRLLGRHNLVPGSSERAELESPRPPPRFFKGFGEVQAQLGLGALARLPALLVRRRACAARYDELLAARGLPVAARAPFVEHGWLRYPLLVDDRERLFVEARHRRLALGDWFRSPLHPLTEGLERWGYHVGTNPVAEAIGRRMVTLPTDVDDDDAARLVDLITSGRRWQPAPSCRQRRA